MIPNGYNVQKQSGQVVTSDCQKITLKRIRCNGVKHYVRAYVEYRSRIDRLAFYGATFEEALKHARQKLSHIDPNIIIEHSSLIDRDALWWAYKEKIDQFENRKIDRICVSLYGTQNLVRVEVRTTDMRLWKEQVRMVFGGKKIALDVALTTALSVVEQLEKKHKIQHELDSRLSHTCQSSQQAAAK